MKSLSAGLIALLILLPSASWAQSNSTHPNPPPSWVSFLQQENAKRSAFFKQMKEDRDAFISANPEVKAYLNEMRQSGQARMAAWRAAHPRKPLTNQ